MTIVFLHFSQIPDWLVMARLQLLQMAILEEELFGDTKESFRYDDGMGKPKSNLGLAAAESLGEHTVARGSYAPMISRTVPFERRGDSRCARLGLLSEGRSRDFARSTARRSYSSQRCAVRVGVHGGVLGSLKREVVLASG